MLLGGLWHGAAWNFVLWGAYHGGVLVLYRAVNNKFKVLKFLADAGAKVDNVSTVSGKSALHYAAMRSDGGAKFIATHHQQHSDRAE